MGLHLGILLKLACQMDFPNYHSVIHHALKWLFKTYSEFVTLDLKKGKKQ